MIRVEWLPFVMNGPIPVGPYVLQLIGVTQNWSISLHWHLQHWAVIVIENPLHA